MLPVYLKTADFEPPTEALYYLLAANGTFLVRRTGLFESVTAVQTVGGLEPHVPALTLSFSRIPRQALERIYGFFLYVYRRWGGEAVAFLYYRPDTHELRVDVPPQRLFRYRTPTGWRTEGRVQYGALARPEGWLKLGDAHSHADAPAFFSNVDDRDDGEDGLRIVLGRLDRIEPDLEASFIASGVRFDLQAREILEPFRTPLMPPERWIRRVTCEDEPVAPPRGMEPGHGHRPH